MKIYVVPEGSRHYEKDPSSKPAVLGIADGLYVFVQALDEVIWASLDRQEHQHPTLLGGSNNVLYAGDFELVGGSIKSLTNCSGTFRPNDPTGLCRVARKLNALGFEIADNAVKFFFWEVRASIEILEWDKVDL